MEGIDLSGDILGGKHSSKSDPPERRARQKKIVFIVALAAIAILIVSFSLNAASPKQNLVVPVPKPQHGVLASNVVRTFLQEDEFNFNLTQGTHVNVTLTLKSGGPNGVRAILGSVDENGNQEPPYLYTTVLKQVGSVVTWTGTIAVSAGYRLELTNMDMTNATVQVYFWAS